MILKSSADLKNWVTGVIDKERKSLLAEVGEIVAGGADEIQNTIEKTPSSISPGKPNRVYTGLMKESVISTEMTSRGKNRWGARVGWVEDREDYFLIQEYGGRAWGKFDVSPMHALHGAWVKIVDKIRAIPGVK